MPKPDATAKPVLRDQLVVGDCIELMRSWPAGSVDLIFADPPYNIGYQYDQYEDRRDDAEYITWTQQWMDGCVHLLKPTGSLYILIGDEYAAEVRLHLKALEKQRKLVFRNWLIWHYTFGQNCKAKFNRSHAHLFYAVGSAAFAAKKTRTADVVQAGEEVVTKLPFTFNKQAVAVPSARQLVYADVRANPTGKLPDDVWYTRPQQAMEDKPHDGQPWLFDPDGDTWYLSRLCGTFKERLGWHPCQLPEALLERIIKLSSHQGDLVFDPFAGSGTTLSVAARLNRHWLGTEMSEDYIHKATQRIKHSQATGNIMAQSTESILQRRQSPKKKKEPQRSAGLV